MSHPQTVQTRFLQLRAEGKSYRAIAAELHVGRSTLLDWGRQFQADIDALRAIRIEALPIPDDFTDPDDQTLPPDLTIPIPAGADDPKTKTRPESDQSETTAETKTRPIPDHADEPIPPPPQNASTIELQRYSAILEEYKFQRHYQKSLQALSPRKLFEKCEQVVDAAAAGKQDQYLDPRPLIENLSPPPDDPQPLLNEPRP